MSSVVLHRPDLASAKARSRGVMFGVMWVPAMPRQAINASALVPFLLGWPPSGTAPSQCPRRPSPVSEALRPGVRTLSSGPAGAARRWMRPVPIGLSMVPRPSVPGAGIHGAGRSPTPRSSACAAGQGSAAAATALGAWAKSIRAAAAGVVPTNTRPQNPAQAGQLSTWVTRTSLRLRVAPSTSTPRSRTTSNGTGDAEDLLRAAGTVAGSTVPLDPEKADAIGS